MSDVTNESTNPWLEVVQTCQKMSEARLDYNRAKRRMLTSISRAIGLASPSDLPDYTNALIALASELDENALKELFPHLLSMASWYNDFQYSAHDIILAMPRDWVREHIEQFAAPILQEGSYQEFSCLSYMYNGIARELDLRLANIALSHPDKDIQELGREMTEPKDCE